jgi:hypothetical protein
MKKTFQDEKAPLVRKVLVGFWVEESLSAELKDAAWERRKTLSQLLREYCRAGLRHGTDMKELRESQE